MNIKKAKKQLVLVALLVISMLLPSGIQQLSADAVPSTSSTSITLLVNGSQAFPAIIECIENARSSIYVNMFIWRDDQIGNELAQKLLEAADRGVQVTVSKDTYGSVCEHAEESATSFFHKKLSLTEIIKVDTLKMLYDPARIPNARDTESTLYQKFMGHPHINTQADVFKADHSKFWIFDDEILILGGVNVEDKENGSDMSGRQYEDFMVKMEGKSYVDALMKARSEGITRDEQTSPYYFGVNRKMGKNSVFQMENLYLDLINSSQDELTIVMAYFSPLRNFTDAILAACNRGVSVRIIIPSHANFQDDSNKKTARYLFTKSDAQIEIYLSPKMLHTKLLMNEQTVTFGSSNITKKAFHQLDELNLFADSSWGTLYQEIRQQVERTIEEADVVTDVKELRYNWLLAWLEGFLV